MEWYEEQIQKRREGKNVTEKKKEKEEKKETNIKTMRTTEKIGS